MKAIQFTGLLATLLAVNAHAATEMIITGEIPITTNPSPSIMKFIEEVEKRTNGEVKGKYFPASQLYNDINGIAAIGTGSVHMVWPVSSRLEALDPRIGIVSLPFSLTTQEMTNNCFVEGLTKQVNSYIEPKGVTVLGFLRTADLMFLMKDKDIQKQEDVSGLKIRVIGGQIMLDPMKSIGASPVSMAASEMSAALSQGAIDGVLSSPAGWADVLGSTAKFGTSVPGMALTTSAVVTDKAWLDSLPKEHSDVIRTVLQEIIVDQWKSSIVKDEELIQKMVQQGATYREMDPAEVEKLKASFTRANQKFVEKNAKAVEELAQVKKECKLNG